MANTTENINYKITVDAQTGTAVVRDLKGQIIATKVPVKQLRDEFGNFAKTVNATNFNKFNKGLSTATKANKNLGDASGAATSSVMELSRVVSDAPYGIRGMANNITQLVSQMGFASKKAGGFGNALKEMGKQFMGPLGIVFLVTAAVSALDFFYGAATKAEKATKDLTSQTFALQQVAKSYADQLQDVNITEERRRVLTKELIKIVPTLKEEDLKYGKNLDEVRKKIKLYTLSQANRLEMDKLVEKNSAVLSAQSKVDNINQIKNAEERLSSIKKLLKEEGVSLQVTTEELVGQSQYGVGIYHKTVRDKTLKEIEGNFQQLKQKLEKESKPVLEKIEELSKGLVIVAGKDKPGDGPAKAFVDSLYREIRGMEDLVANSDLVLGDLEIKVKPVTPDEDEMAIFIENYKILMSGITDFVDGEFERQLTREQNKTNALNEELNNRLLNESLSEEKRKSIQNQIAQNDEALRVKQDAIKKKQFKQQKAFNISMAIISTYSAAAKTLNETPGGSFARIAGMVAVIGSGLAQVAAISRQKFQSSSAQAPINTSSQGGAAGGGERSEPSFNIVGRSNNNQLLNAIQSQFDKPLKAYVVARDVTNQQQLDGVISTSAST